LVARHSPPEAEIGLLARGVGELHRGPSMGRRRRGRSRQRLARAVVGARVTSDAAHFGQVSFVSGTRGVVRVDAARLNRVNAQDDVLLLTGEPDRPVEAGDVLGVVKCAPLFMAQQTLLAVEAIGITDGPVIEVQPFHPTRVACRDERHGVAHSSRSRGPARRSGGMVRALSAPSPAKAASDGLPPPPPEAHGAGLILPPGCAAAPIRAGV
jgi:hypothetical protein